MLTIAIAKQVVQSKNSAIQANNAPSEDPHLFGSEGPIHNGNYVVIHTAPTEPAASRPAGLRILRRDT